MDNRPSEKINFPTMIKPIKKREISDYETREPSGSLDSFIGLFKEADGGIIFLPNIDSWPLIAQYNLLFAIQQNEEARMMGHKHQHYNFRLICSSSKKIREEVSKGNFLEELFRKLCTNLVSFPKLRMRPESILPIMQITLDEFNDRCKRNVAGFSKEIKSLFQSYNWPGNIPQLKSEVERLADLTPDGQVITIKHCTIGHVPLNRKVGESLDSFLSPRKKEYIEIQKIKNSLRKTGGNKTQTAKLLGITRRTLHKKIKLYGIAVQRTNRRANRA